MSALAVFPRQPALLITAALVFAGCSTFAPESPPCVGDQDCPSGTLCFAEGCGDPGSGIVVEVEGVAQSNHKARDFAIDDGTLGATQNFALGAPLVISGQLQRELSAGNPADRTSYTETVVVRAVGTSSLLPGVTRSFETTFDKPEFGFYEMSLGAGTFKVTATPANPQVPPAISSATVGSSSIAPSVSFAFPAVDTQALTGQLVKKLTQLEPILISSGLDGGLPPDVDVQLFDPATDQPLSQRFPVGATEGGFTIPVSPEARMKSKLAFVASPREPGVAVPTKRFVLETPLPEAIALEYGDYGEAGDLVGRVVDERSIPVVDAHVVIEGTVVGDGVFRSKIVKTDAEGEFHLRVLGSKSDGAFQITVAPPETSPAAYLRKNISVTVTFDANQQKWVANMKPAAIVLADRLVVTGRVVSASDPDAGVPNVGVTATFQGDEGASTGEVRSLPVDPAEALSDANGDFTMRLDPGMWRFEYRAGGQVPLTTRLVKIAQLRDDLGNEIDHVTLSTVPLSNGRTVNGVVTGLKGNQLEAGLSFAKLRFFRVTRIGGKPVSVLLGESICDESGRYTVVLPTVMKMSNSGGLPATP